MSACDGRVAVVSDLLLVLLMFLVVVVVVNSQKSEVPMRIYRRNPPPHPQPPTLTPGTPLAFVGKMARLVGHVLYPIS